MRDASYMSFEIDVANARRRSLWQAAAIASCHFTFSFRKRRTSSPRPRRAGRPRAEAPRDRRRFDACAASCATIGSMAARASTSARSDKLARLGVGVDLLREQHVARTADDRAAVAARHACARGPASRGCAAPRVSSRGPGPRLGSQRAFGRQLIARHVLPAQDVPTQPFREYLGRLRLRNHSHSRGQAFPPIDASGAPLEPMVVWTKRRGQCSMVGPNRGR